MSIRRDSIRLLKRFAVFAPLLLAVGCADYLNHRDSITLAAGDAVHRNQAIHTVEHALPCVPQYPCPHVAYRTELRADGTRILRVIRYYKNPPAAPASPVVNVNVNTGS
jgi:hypothetical protein